MTVVKDDLLEWQVQIDICDYLRKWYPDVIFRSDAGGLRLHAGLRKTFRKMQSDKSYPDMFIAEPRHGYHGMYIELKKEGTIVYRKTDNRLSQVDHIRHQSRMLLRLREKGYCAVFAVGFDHAIFLIKRYLGNREQDNLPF